jgi:hypothetical protein
MRFYFIKKGDLYLHIKGDEVEQYDDYSDIYAMSRMWFEFLPEKEGAKHFLRIDEAQTYIAKKGRKLKGALPVLETAH